MGIVKAGIMMVFILCMFTFQSCVVYKNVPYFKDLPDTAKPILVKTVPFKNPVIQKDDILSVSIQTMDNEITSLINNSGTASGSSGQGVGGYLVDNNGEIELAFAGKIKVEGLTTLEAKDIIRKEVDKYFNSPVVNVRFANFKITVLGEVTNPSTIVVANEKINLFDALGLAGDMTIYGMRENVLLMRDSVDGKALIRMNLNSKDIVSSPYFYLQPNDILYVQPGKNVTARDEAVANRNNVSIITSIVSLALVIVTLITK